MTHTDAIRLALVTGLGWEEQQEQQLGYLVFKKPGEQHRFYLGAESGILRLGTRLRGSRCLGDAEQPGMQYTQLRELGEKIAAEQL